jgi:GTPase SAR1 family protein
MMSHLTNAAAKAKTIISTGDSGQVSHFKVVFVAHQAAVGKSCIFNRIINGSFS